MLIFIFISLQAPNQPLACNRSVCMGSVMFGANFQVAQNEIRKADVIVEHAKNFLDQYFTSIRRYVYVHRYYYFVHLKFR